MKQRQRPEVQSIFASILARTTTRSLQLDPRRMGRRGAEMDISERALAFALRSHAPRPCAHTLLPVHLSRRRRAPLPAFHAERGSMRWAAFRKPRSARPQGSSSTGSRRCLQTGALAAGMWTCRPVRLGADVWMVTSHGHSRSHPRLRLGEAGIIM